MIKCYTASLIFRYRTGNFNFGFPLCEIRRIFAKTERDNAITLFKRIGSEAECEGCEFIGISKLREIAVNISLNDLIPVDVESFYSFTFPNLNPFYSLRLSLETRKSSERPEQNSKAKGNSDPYYAKLLFEKCEACHRWWKPRVFSYKYFAFKCESLIAAMAKCYEVGIKQADPQWKFCGIADIMNEKIIFDKQIGDEWFDFWYDFSRIPLVLLHYYQSRFGKDRASRITL